MRRGLPVLALLHVEARRARLSLGLLVARRPAIFLVVDGLVLFAVLIAALAGGGDLRALYAGLVIVPTLLLGVPIMSDAVALERRAGSLDLALSSPGSRFLFERRIGAACALLVAQGWAILLLNWLLDPNGFPLAPPLLQTLLLTLVVGSLSLFWATRVRTAGAVAFATLVSVAALAPWTLWIPLPEKLVRGALIPPWEDVIAWAKTSAVLAATSAVVYLHARRRLDRPELLLS